jgi:hypothetical protein
MVCFPCILLHLDRVSIWVQSMNSCRYYLRVFCVTLLTPPGTSTYAKLYNTLSVNNASVFLSVVYSHKALETMLLVRVSFAAVIFACIIQIHRHFSLATSLSERLWGQEFGMFWTTTLSMEFSGIGFDLEKWSPAVVGSNRVRHVYG